MAKKKKKKKSSYLKSGVSTIAAGVGIGVMPDISGTAAETTIKTKTMTGLSKVSSTFPTRGKIKGTGMVFGALGKLRKKSKKLV